MHEQFHFSLLMQPGKGTDHTIIQYKKAYNSFDAEQIIGYEMYIHFAP